MLTQNVDAAAAAGTFGNQTNSPIVTNHCGSHFSLAVRGFINAYSYYTRKYELFIYINEKITGNFGVRRRSSMDLIE